MSKESLDNDPDLVQMNSRLGGTAKDIIKEPGCRLLFESCAEFQVPRKDRKDCLVYILTHKILICRPKKVGKKYYIKLQYPVSSSIAKLDTIPESDLGVGEVAPILIGLSSSKSSEYIRMWLPNVMLNSAFLQVFADAKEVLEKEANSRMYWKSLTMSLCFSYESLIKEVYSTIRVENGGNALCNGVFYPVGFLNECYVWRNDKDIFLSREYIDGQLGWVLGDLTVCYYSCRTDSSIPSNSDKWKNVSGQLPIPAITVCEFGENAFTHSLRLSSLQMLDATKCPNRLDNSVVIKSVCSEFIFGEQSFYSCITQVIEPYITSITSFTPKSLSMPPSPVDEDGGSDGESMYAHQNRQFQVADEDRYSFLSVNRLSGCSSTRSLTPSLAPSLSPFNMASTASLTSRTSESRASGLSERVSEYRSRGDADMPSRQMKGCFELRSSSDHQLLLQRSSEVGGYEDSRDSVFGDELMNERLGDHVLSSLFYTIAEIKELSKMLLDKLIHCQPTNETVSGDIVNALATLSGRVEVYAEYIKHLPAAIDRLRDLLKDFAFAEMVEQTRKQVGVRGRSLESALLLPVERILQFERLLTNLLSLIPRTSSVLTRVNDLTKILNPIFDLCHSSLKNIGQVAPLTQSLILSVPLTVIGDTDNRYFGAYDCLIGSLNSVLTTGTRDTVRGKLNLFQNYILFSITDQYIRQSQIAVFFFDSFFLLVERFGDSRFKALVMDHPIDIMRGDQRCKMIVIFENENDRVACEKTLKEIIAASGATSTISSEPESLHMNDVFFEMKLNPNTSHFANIRDEMAMQRLQVYREYIFTELAFIDDLSIALEVYYQPMMKALMKHTLPLTEEQVTGLFAHIQEISELHTAFISQIKNGIDDYQLSDLLARSVSVFCTNCVPIYSVYCKEHYKSLELIQRLTVEHPEFENYLLYLGRNPRSKGLDLPSFLIKPIQRICKYPLFLKRVSDALEQGHPWRKEIAHALDVMNSVLATINESVQDAECYNQMYQVLTQMYPPQSDLIIPTRRFRCELHAKVGQKGKSRKELVVFVFNDAIVFAKSTRSSLFSKETCAFRELIHTLDFEFSFSMDALTITLTRLLKPSSPPPSSSSTSSSTSSSQTGKMVSGGVSGGVGDIEIEFSSRFEMSSAVRALEKCMSQCVSE